MIEELRQMGNEVLTDWASIGQVPDKLKEHYGIELCVSTIRHLTEHHAQRVSTAQALDKPTPYPTHAGSARLILETDGSMIPIVEVDADAPDKRKHKTESWKEARLCLAHEHGNTQVHFGGAFQACHRYLSNRLTQLDYPRARALGLPIGSGEIESAHRYVIQKRLKLSGAWWKEDNAKNMLALRIL